MRHAWFVTLASAAILFSPAALEAQTIPSPYRYIETSQSVVLSVGYLNLDTGEQDLGPRPGPLLGAGYSIRFAGPVTGTIGVSLIPSSRTVYERVIVSADSAVLEPLGDANLLLLLGEAGLRFNITGARTWNGLAPYLAATAGLMGNVLPRPQIEEDIETAQRVSVGPAFALGLSAGTDWFLTERLSLRAEARNYVWRLTTPEGLSPTLRRDSRWTQNPGLAFGVALHF